MSLRWMSFNVRGLNHPAKRRNLWKTAMETCCDIICIQETHFAKDKAPKCSHPRFPYVFFAHNYSKRNGVLIAIKDTVSFKLLSEQSDDLGRFVLLVAEINGALYTLINIYAPNKKPVKFIKKMVKLAKQKQKGSLILCGDFNAVMNTDIDCSSVGRRRRPNIGPFCYGEGLYDPWRCLHTTEKDYSYFSGVHGSYSRIDLFLTDKFTLQKITKAHIHSITWSDHAPVTMEIIDRTKSVHRPLWRNNTYILAHPQFSAELQKKLTDYFVINNDGSCSPTTVWCAHKAVARGLLIQQAAREKKNRSQRIQSIQAKITRLERQHKQAPDRNSTILSQLNNLRTELKQTLMADYDFHYKRLRVSWYSQNNKAGKLLASQLKRKRIKACIPYLKHHITNTSYSNPKDIAEVFKDYYASLYNLEDSDPSVKPSAPAIQQFLNSLNLPSLDDAILQDINKPISQDEVLSVIKSLPLHKSPGIDGFSAEYYKTFSHILAPHLVEIFNTAASTGTFPKEMLQAVIITIPKPGKNPDLPQNFRPISLLNVDIKIYAKILANRLLQVTPSLIGLDQVGFVKGRQAPDGTRRMINLLTHLEINHTPSVLLALDAEKAFDRVHWGYLSATLTKFGFQGTIQSAIMALYSSPSACVYNDGLLSQQFNLTNGTRQGCPLSPVLFSLAIEPLAEAIRINPNIVGIHIGPKPHKLGLFADDIILTLTDPSTSLVAIQHLIETFSMVSLYKVNMSKCSALPVCIPSKKLTELKSIFPCNWDAPSITYLGIQLTTPTANLYKCNFLPLLSQIEEEFHQLRKIHLSWLGRIAAYKMQILPKLLYYFRTLPIPIPQLFFEKLASKLRQFIWDGKKPRISLSKLYESKQSGGVSLPNAQAYYYAAVLSQTRFWFSDQEDNLWNQIEQQITEGHDLPALAIAACIDHRVICPQYPTIVATITAWTRLLKLDFGDTICKTLCMPSAAYTFLIPGISTLHWKKQGINYFSDTITNPSVLDSFTLHQINSYRRTNTPPTLRIPVHIWKYLLNSLNPKCKGISLFYKLFHQITISGKSPSMVKWEYDLNHSFPMVQWLEAFKANCRSSACVDHWDNAQKILHRYYMTPTRLHKMDSTISPLCWRDCQEMGNLTHVFWYCPMIQPLWQAVFSLISHITGKDCASNPALALLSIGINEFPPQSRTVTAHILFATRIALAKLWRSPSPPHLEEIKNRVNLHCEMERMLAYKERRATAFHKKWDTWLAYTSNVG